MKSSRLPHFNRALDQLKGDRTEPELAAEFGVSDDTLRSYRKGHFGKGIERILHVPALCEALAEDARAIQTQNQANDQASQITGA